MGDRKKNSPCHYFHIYGVCARGERCQYLHGRSIIQEMKAQIEELQGHQQMWREVWQRQLEEQRELRAMITRLSINLPPQVAPSDSESEDEPIIQEPIVQEPIVQEPIVQEPVQEPIVQFRAAGGTFKIKYVSYDRKTLIVRTTVLKHINKIRIRKGEEKIDGPEFSRKITTIAQDGKRGTNEEWYEALREAEAFVIRMEETYATYGEEHRHRLIEGNELGDLILDNDKFGAWRRGEKARDVSQNRQRERERKQQERKQRERGPP
jgi:hypothetical protein